MPKRYEIVNVIFEFSSGGQHHKISNPVLADHHAKTNPNRRYQTSQTRDGDYDVISQASGAYVGKRATTATAASHPLRPTSVAYHSRTIKLTPNARTYYPDGYFNRVGYQKSETATTSSH